MRVAVRVAVRGFDTGLAAADVNLKPGHDPSQREDDGILYTAT